VIAILPIGAEEEHGPHLPLATDTIMAVGFAERLSERLDGMLLPTIPYGETWTTSGYPSTISLSYNTVLANLLDIGASLEAQGVSALVIINGHFGNQAPLEQVSRQLLTELVLAIKPETVHMDRTEAEYPEFPAVFGSVPLKLDSFCKCGVFGHPRPATAEKGERLLKALEIPTLKLIRIFLDTLDK
jgi:creatinine amidohydrolase